MVRERGQWKVNQPGDRFGRGTGRLAVSFDHRGEVPPLCLVVAQDDLHVIERTDQRPRLGQVEHDPLGRLAFRPLKLDFNAGTRPAYGEAHLAEVRGGAAGP